MLNQELSLECRNTLAPAVNAKPGAGDAYSRGFFEVGMVPAYTVVEISSHPWRLVGPTHEPRAPLRPPGGPWGSRSSPWFPRHSTGFLVFPGLRLPRHPPGSVFPRLRLLGLPLPSYFYRSWPTALGWTAGRPPAPELLLPSDLGDRLYHARTSCQVDRHI